VGGGEGDDQMEELRRGIFTMVARSQLDSKHNIGFRSSTVEKDKL
jgi:hypothetical protein